MLAAPLGAAADASWCHGLSHMLRPRRGLQVSIVLVQTSTGMVVSCSPVERSVTVQSQAPRCPCSLRLNRNGAAERRPRRRWVDPGLSGRTIASAPARSDLGGRGDGDKRRPSSCNSAQVEFSRNWMSIMTSKRDPVPGTWVRLSPTAYRRLVRLAKFKLGGSQASAEDVVSRAIIRWRSIDPQKRGVARIEQVVKSEAASLSRSEWRRRSRESLYSTDRSRSPWAPTEIHMSLLLQDLEHVADTVGIAISESDRQLLEVLIDGVPMTHAANSLGLTRHQARRSRDQWRLVFQSIEST